MEQFSPGWAAKWGDMVNLMVRDAAAYDRNDTMFPYLRNFSPYAGHSWVDGFANNPQGNNMESSSESMNFNSALIQWGQLTNNKAIRDLGIYLYSTEQTGIEEYYMDTKHRNFPKTQQYSLVSRVWANSNDNGTFWTSDIAASYGIEMYPINGGSMYLGQDTVYAKRLWDEIVRNTGIANNQVNPNLWHDIMWEYESFINPAKAIERYNSYPNREIKFGISDAQTYHWLHAMNVLGRVDASITANYPMAVAFRQGNKINYAAQNFTATPLTVTFSTGYQLVVPAGKMRTNLDGNFSGTITSSFAQASVGGSVKLSVAVAGGSPSKVEWMDGNTSLGVTSAAPYMLNASNLQLGIHDFYARIYDGTQFNVTNTTQVVVGNQLPYGGGVSAIPGTIEAGKFDIFEGGKGQNISYLDVTPANLGSFRLDESVDASIDTNEGAIVGSIASGEWLEYSINVAQSGLYSMSFRYASGNSAGGGPFHLELDGQKISSDIAVPSTSSTVWTVWASKTVADIALTAGKHMLRVVFSSGEFNLGRMTFARTGDFIDSYPTANAGTDVKVVLPLTSTSLDGSASIESASKTLSYKWKQIFGPTVVTFSDATVSKPMIGGLVEGMYKFSLTVTNPDLRSAMDEVLVMVTSTSNVAPSVSLTSPENNSTFTESKPVTISANASDFDGTIQKVDFYQGTTLLQSVTAAPYTMQWTPTVGNYLITAKATDNEGAESTSQAAYITISPIMKCTQTSTAASQGAFTKGYKCTFETVGTTVYITFELLDDKSGVIAYLWKESPFSESQMANVSGKIFTATLGGQTVGSTLSYACKFAYTGGMSVTKYLTYVVGDNCIATNDTIAPTNFTATVGAITASTVELLLKADDNSGTVVYKVAYGATTSSLSTQAGVQKSLIISPLNANTPYSFSITASDLAGNVATNNPIILTATTAAVPNTDTECTGTSSEATQGSFAIGCKYQFETVGTTVNLNFELLDDKAGVVAYIWNYTSGFSETSMTNVSAKKFTKALTNQTAGTVIKIACKFAYAGGMVVTKIFSYTVGNKCLDSAVEYPMASTFFVYPNPVTNLLNISLPDENNRLIITDMVGKVQFSTSVKATTTLNMSKYKNGIYLIIVENRYGKQISKIIKK